MLYSDKPGWLLLTSVRSHICLRELLTQTQLKSLVTWLSAEYRRQSAPKTQLLRSNLHESEIDGNVSCDETISLESK